MFCGKTPLSFSFFAVGLIGIYNGVFAFLAKHIGLIETVEIAVRLGQVHRHLPPAFLENIHV